MRVLDATHDGRWLLEMNLAAVLRAIFPIDEILGFHCAIFMHINLGACTDMIANDLISICHFHLSWDLMATCSRCVELAGSNHLVMINH